MYARRVYNVLLPALTFAFYFQWITEGRLGEDITGLYKDLSNYRDGGLSAFESFRFLTFLFLATVTEDDTHDDTEGEIQKLFSIFWKLVRLLRLIPQQDEAEEKEEELVFLQADLVNELHRICAGLMNAFSVAPKPGRTGIFETFGCKPQSVEPMRWALYVSFRHHSVTCILSQTISHSIAHAHRFMWKSLHNFDNPPFFSTGAWYGPHFDAADYYFKMAQSPTHELGDSEAILTIVEMQEEFIWDAFQNPEWSCNVLYEGIKSARKNLDPHQPTPEMSRISHQLLLRLESITPEALERQNPTVMAAPDNDSTPSGCSKCLNSKPHETPTVRTTCAQHSWIRTHLCFFQWIKPGPLSEATLSLYECLGHPDDGGPSAMRGFHSLTSFTLGHHCSQSS